MLNNRVDFIGDLYVLLSISFFKNSFFLQRSFLIKTLQVEVVAGLEDLGGETGSSLMSELTLMLVLLLLLLCRQPRVQKLVLVSPREVEKQVWGRDGLLHDVTRMMYTNNVTGMLQVWCRHNGWWRSQHCWSSHRQSGILHGNDLAFSGWNNLNIFLTIYN